MEEPSISQLQEKIHRLEQELAAARARELENKNQNTPSTGHITQAEEALGTSEERLRFVTEQSPDNIFIQDRDLRYVWVAKPAQPLTIEEYLGRTDFDLLPTEEAQNLTELKMRVLTEGQPVSAEIPLHLKGQERIFEVLYKPWRDTEDRVVGLAGYVRDITNRKNAEQALRKSEERYRSLFESIEEGFCVLEMLFDEGGRPVDYRWLEINPAFERHTGLVNTVGRTARELVPNLESKWVEIYGRIALTGQPEQFREHSEAMGRWFDVDAFRIGEPAERHVALLFTDITESKRTEEALRVSEAKFRSVFEQAAVGIGRASFTGARWIDVNEAFCQMLGYTPEETRATPWPRITHPDDLDLDLIPFRRMAAGELDSYSVEKRFIHKEGHHIWARLTLSLVRDPHGQPDYEIAVIENITERKRAEDALKEAKTAAEAATRAKSEFLANMSHEIRTPMTVFMAAVEHLLQIDRNPERRHLLSMAEQSAQRLRGLIDDVLDISRIEARKVEIEEKPFEVRGVVRAAVELFTLPAREKNLRLQVEIAPETPATVAGDAARIGQVLINLLGNAVKFTQQGEVRVCVQPRGEMLEFAVADTGIGIAEEKHALLFQSFSQVDASFHRKYGGTGLGLAISKGLVELMGGEIAVQSRAAEGSVFTFTVPLRQVAQPSAQAAASAEEVPKETAAARILLAEDEPMIREMISIILAQRGLHPDTAESGRQALEKWQVGGFDLILMDLQMPEMNGLEATQAIRQQENGGRKRTCIIGLTGHASREIREQCLEAGMDQVLTKPVRIKDLLTAVDTCL